MLDFIWDPQGYFFWLLIISTVCWILERLVPWRKEQEAFRKQIGQDFFWLVFNGHFAGVLLAYLTFWIATQINTLFLNLDFPAPDTLNVIAGAPLWLQFIVYFILSDFIEWCVHNLLHRVSWMWEFHKLHHSIMELDWIGNFRFHWMEIIIYRTVKYFPLVILGVGTDYGIFRYILNSPRFHVWHHDLILQGKHGQNFAIVFSIWDWIFGTAFYPADREQPAFLGFEKMDEFPKTLFKRLLYPLVK